MLSLATELPQEQSADIVLAEHDWIAAASLIKLYGDNAAMRAAIRADAMAAHGDEESHAFWKRIVWAINEMTRTTLLAR